jgi:hypothetical protein
MTKDFDSQLDSMLAARKAAKEGAAKKASETTAALEEFYSKRSIFPTLP